MSPSLRPVPGLFIRPLRTRNEKMKVLGASRGGCEVILGLVAIVGVLSGFDFFLNDCRWDDPVLLLIIGSVLVMVFCLARIFGWSVLRQATTRILRSMFAVESCRMDAKPNRSRSFFSIAAWYALLAPLAATGGVYIGLAIRHSHVPQAYRYNPASDAFLGIAYLVSISSAFATYVSLFGISKYGTPIIWKSIVGLVLSCAVFFWVVNLSIPVPQ